MWGLSVFHRGDYRQGVVNKPMVSEVNEQTAFLLTRVNFNSSMDK